MNLYSRLRICLLLCCGYSLAVNAWKLPRDLQDAYDKLPTFPKNACRAIQKSARTKLDTFPKDEFSTEHPVVSSWLENDCNKSKHAFNCRQQQLKQSFEVDVCEIRMGQFGFEHILPVFSMLVQHSCTLKRFRLVLVRL